MSVYEGSSTTLVINVASHTLYTSTRYLPNNIKQGARTNIQILMFRTCCWSHDPIHADILLLCFITVSATPHHTIVMLLHRYIGHLSARRIWTIVSLRSVRSILWMQDANATATANCTCRCTCTCISGPFVPLMVGWKLAILVGYSNYNSRSRSMDDVFPGACRLLYTCELMSILAYFDSGGRVLDRSVD